MERRHQVFISSTFSDLINERAEIIRALLELDAFPAGMEMFPATNKDAWELIKGVIDDSDYYCLVIAGRYGSLDENGIGFTEKEYDYAVSIGKPLIAFLHKAPSNISTAKSEQNSDGKTKLEEFRKKVESAHHCKYWSSPEELGGQVSRGLISLRKSNPSEGWVPGIYAIDEASRIELANLRAKVAELQTELAKINLEDSQKISEDIAGGNDVFIAEISFTNKENIREDIVINVTWDEILGYVGPSLLAECSEENLLKKIDLCFYHKVQDASNWEGVKFASIVVPYMVIDQIKVQLRALGQMTRGTQRRAVSDQKIYWKLTSLGEARLLKIQALSKPHSVVDLFSEIKT